MAKVLTMDEQVKTGNRYASLGYAPRTAHQLAMYYIEALEDAYIRHKATAKTKYNLNGTHTVTVTYPDKVRVVFTVSNKFEL